MATTTTTPRRPRPLGQPSSVLPLTPPLPSFRGGGCPDGVVLLPLIMATVVRSPARRTLVAYGLLFIIAVLGAFALFRGPSVDTTTQPSTASAPAPAQTFPRRQTSPLSSARLCNQIKGGLARRRCFYRQRHEAGEDVLSSVDQHKANNGADAARNADQAISVPRPPPANGKRPKRILVTCLQASGCSLFIVLLGQVRRRNEVTTLSKPLKRMVWLGASSADANERRWPRRSLSLTFLSRRTSPPQLLTSRRSMQTKSIGKDLRACLTHAAVCL